MTPLEELVHLSSERSRRIFVAQEPIDLSASKGRNFVYVLELPVSPGSAGGRIGGFGERKVVKLICFRQEGESWVKVLELDDAEKLGHLQLPYHATGLSILLPDKTERVVSGVVDKDFIRAYAAVV
jgi:hypothetical protein